MGLLSANTTDEGTQFCVFDSRRGQHEGQELDKILFFYPSECPFTAQLSVVGLCEGMITFTRIFSPEAPCEVIEAERRSYVFYEAEPDIWIVMILEKSKYSESVWRFEDLRAVLKEMHSLFVMFHGSVKNLLDEQPSGEFARSHLYYFFTDYLTDFTIGKKVHLPTFRECLKERGTVQMLTISRDVAIEIQSLVTTLGSRSGCSIENNSLIFFQDLLVSTTLSPDDTTNLFSYYVMRLSPHALSSSSRSSTWSYIRKSTASSVSNVSSLPNAVRAASDGSHGTSRDTSPDGEPWTVNVPRPLQRDSWSKGEDGFLATDMWGQKFGTSLRRTPTILLQQLQERMYLCVYQYKSLTIVVLVPMSSLVDGEQGIALVKEQLLENVSENILNIEEKLSRGWGGENAYHVAGYRYLLVDCDRNISRASPPAKVTTLSKDSLLALNNLRVEVDLENRSKLGNLEYEKDFEACIRTKNNAWVIAKISRGRELYMALEKGGETLLFASEAVERFSNRYCDGAFSLD